MGETENNNKRDKEISVNVQVDRSFELEALRQENDSEILELRNTLTAIAERTLNEKCDRFKIDKSLSDDEKINAVKAKSLEHSNTALLNDAQTKDYSNSNNEATFDSIESGILELNEMAKTSEVIKKELCRTAKRALKPNNGTVFDYELEPFFLSSFAYPAPYYSHKNGVNFFCGSCGLGFYVLHTLDAYFIILPAHHFNLGD